MRKESSRHHYAVQNNARVESSHLSRSARLGLAAALCGSLAFFRPEIPRAQQRYKEPSVNVTGVTTSGNVVSISADGSLGRAQTWQDPEGFHVILVNGQAGPAASSRGVKVRRVGNSLELVVAVKPGASVTVQPRGSRLDLVVSGGTGALSVENFPAEERAESKPKARADETKEQSAESDESRAQASQSKRHGATEAARAESSQPSSAQSVSPSQKSAPDADAVNLAQSAQPASAPVEVKDAATAQAAAAQLKTDEGFDFFGALFSLPSLFVFLGAALAVGAVFVFRRARKGAEVEEDEPSEPETKKKTKASERESESANAPFTMSKGDRRKSSIVVPFERRTSGHGAEDLALRELRLEAKEGKNDERRERGLQSHSAASTPFAVRFGAYRIDQEVARLVEGQSHSIEVLASRATDDRRAVETSLLKALRDAETDEDGRRRVRMALEDYGFVARSCAALLLSTENYERVSAARTLGEMKSAQALPFLTEALYDPDSVVRMECVQGLGALGLPSAIGALLDVARRHPDISASVVGPALTACSVESLELSWDAARDSRTFVEMDEEEEFTGEVRMLAPVGAEFEELPEWIEDESLQGALEKLASSEVESRVHSAQHLAQFQVRRSVEALAAMALDDSEPTVRAAAVTSLGVINHETVFVHVIIALADEAREVRAAAARSLSRLSFERADAYVRVIETADPRTLRQVAQACIKAGIASQAISRLASEDRRQAYEAFSLLSLVARAGETQPILDTIECHRDIEVRLVCIRLLDVTRQSTLAEQLLRIAGNGGVPERVRRAILETVERAEQLQPVAK
jgi:HEAT repeat protein